MKQAQPEKEIVIEHTFDAPRELVWEAWTTPEHVAQWWGPKGFSTRVEKLELKEGGKTRYVMVGPDGNEYPAEGTFTEIDAPKKFVTTDEFPEDFDDSKTDLPQGKTLLTALFEDLGEQTKLTLRILHETVQDREKHEKMGVVQGWNSSLQCLEEHLEGR